jgi:hypothetical protein
MNEASGRERTWERRVRVCKKKHRPKLINWQRDEFGTRRHADFSELKFKYLNENEKSIERYAAKDLTVEKFISDYERNATPLVITDIPKNERWNAGLSCFNSRPLPALTICSGGLGFQMF